MLNAAELCKNLILQRFNVPQNITDPESIVQYLLNTGQVSQKELNNVVEIKNNPNLLQQILSGFRR